MNVSTISFDVWCKNHTDDHDAKWCRELYPWEVFQRLNYDTANLGIPQAVTIAGEKYIATIEKRYVAENERTNYLIRLRNILSDRKQQWNQRVWNDPFHLVAAPSGNFITLYTQKRDPSKVLLGEFMKSRLKNIQAVRSLPISSLLFRSLVSYAAHDLYKGLQRFRTFAAISASDLAESTLGGPARQGKYEPFLSRDRDLWIISSFTEEKAHRQSLRIAGQAERVVAVFCHPTFARHHRCFDESVSVVSLSDFIRMSSPIVHRRYIHQVRFLINHLRQDFEERGNELASDSMRDILLKEKRPVPIHTSDLREAKAGLGMVVTTTADVAYVCACANLLNAALNRRLKTYDGSLKLFKEVYSFKAILGRTIEEIVWNPPANVRVYVERDGLVYVSVRGLQFSFHAVPRTSAISEYQWSKHNVPQAWAEKRLQPVAPLVLKWARALLREEKWE